MADLKSFLDALGLGRYADVLAENDIDLDILPDLTDQDLAQLGLSLGHRRKLMAAAQRGIAAPAAPAPEPAQPPPQAASQAERRQVTVLFADLVGSTELSRRLDPEDLSRIVRQYQDACAGVIARFDGFLAKFMGDGVLAYFGFPQAHEDSTERAARAGLEIAAATRRIGDGTLAARIGIATGLVVVGEIIGSGAATEQTIIGETPNLAARLQSLAEPDAVLIAGMTRRLLGALFEYDFLGEHDVKGHRRAGRRVARPARERHGRAASRPSARPARSSDERTRSRSWPSAGAAPAPAKARSCCSPARPASASRASSRRWSRRSMTSAMSRSACNARPIIATPRSIR